MSLKKSCKLLSVGLSFFSFTYCAQIHADESDESASTEEAPYESISFDGAFVKCVGNCFSVVETEDKPNLRVYAITGFLDETNHRNQNWETQITVLDVYCSLSGDVLRGKLEVYWETSDSPETSDLMNPDYVEVSNLRCVPIAPNPMKKKESEFLCDSEDVENSEDE